MKIFIDECAANDAGRWFLADMACAGNVAVWLDCMLRAVETQFENKDAPKFIPFDLHVSDKDKGHTILECGAIAEGAREYVDGLLACVKAFEDSDGFDNEDYPESSEAVAIIDDYIRLMITNDWMVIKADMFEGSLFIDLDGHTA